MAEERLGHDWNQTAAVMAVIANTVRDPKKKPRPYTPTDFNPIDIARRRRRAREYPAPITVLRDVFIDGRMPADPNPQQ